jgi:hypothetical protein
VQPSIFDTDSNTIRVSAWANHIYDSQPFLQYGKLDQNAYFHSFNRYGPI